jgi:hypothetical protein
MQRSSSSIAGLAAALAKAQAVLVNPEKSLVGTIPADHSGGIGRSFRYASLASGLEIVRKTLGEHEIATVQTTAIDQAAGIVNLTTVLAHSSGEWIASDWPVCTISETSTPRRMGASLTYARRYALFTLVGIAGEDDLDAPDLPAPTGHGSASERAASPNSTKLNGHSSRSPQPAGDAKTKTSPRPVLEPGASAEHRDRLVSQIAELGSADDAALWAYCNMRAKNGLTAGDARQVEEAFKGKLAGFAGPLERLSSEGRDVLPRAGSVIQGSAEGPDELATPKSCPAAAPADCGDAKPPSPPVRSRRSRGRRRAKSAAGIDKAVLAFPEPRRIRDREHVRFVARQPCLICGRTPSDPHHLRFTQSRALGRKVSDEFTVPLCRGHHREVHRSGDEAAWWRKASIDPTVAARTLWLETHPLSPGGAGDWRPPVETRGEARRYETKPLGAADNP